MKSGWKFSEAGSLHFVGQPLAGMIMLTLLNTYVTHGGWRERFYRPGSISLPCKVCLGSFGQYFSGTVCDAQLSGWPPVRPVGRNRLDP